MTTSRDACGSPQVVDLDVSWMVSADLGVVDALARLQVVALRRGRSLEIHGADPGLAELLASLGLDLVVHLCPRCSVSASESESGYQGESEDLEQ